jgi:hypothetical protein
MKLNMQDMQALSIKGSMKQTIKTDIKQETVDTSNPVLLEDIDAGMERIEGKINYLKKMEISWTNWADYWDDYEYGNETIWANVNIERVEGSTRTYFDAIYEDETLYVPMREVLKHFNEEVVWDNDDKKAYVIRGDQRIEMEGRLEYKTMFINIMDLEKLGYTVEHKYDKDEWSSYGRHTITIK